jgi:L-asparaginase
MRDHLAVSSTSPGTTRAVRVLAAGGTIAMRGERATVTTGLGDDGAILRHAAQTCDGVVLVALGAGHLSPAVLHELRAATERVPVLITCRPDRSSMLFSNYGFEGAERDLRASGAVCVPFLSPAAARVALLCALGAGLDRAGIEGALALFDAR